MKPARVVAPHLSLAVVLVFLIGVLAAGAAGAQTATVVEPQRPLQPYTPPTAQPAAPPAAPQQGGQPQVTYTPIGPQGAASAPVQPSALPSQNSPQTAAGLARFRSGRVAYGFGTVVGLAGSGLIISGLIAVPVTGDETLGALVYGGSGAHTVGFMLQSVGLGLQHNAMDQLGIPTNRGLFGLGATCGLLGLLGVGAGYVFGATTDLVPDQTRVALGVSVAGALLQSLGSIFYWIDSRQMVKTLRSRRSY
jgi:hypothetical protein